MVDLEEPGGTLMIKLFLPNLFCTSACTCSQIASMCQFHTSGVAGSMIGHAPFTNSAKLRRMRSALMSESAGRRWRCNTALILWSLVPNLQPFDRQQHPIKTGRKHWDQHISSQVLVQCPH